MKKNRKLLAFGLAVVMTMLAAACGNGESGNPSSGSGTPNSENTGNQGNTGNTASDGTRTMNIGVWYINDYDSSSTKLEDLTDYTLNLDAEGDDEETLESKAFNRAIAEKKFAKVSEIENTYNVKYYWKNLTYEGVKESVNTSILAGSPDCDFYRLDAAMAVPAQVNGLALDLKTILPADSDLFTDQTVLGYLDLNDGKVSILINQMASEQVASTYPLGFNVQMLEDNNLEDPRELYKRGEWTWEKFIEYCQVLTQDTDGDGQTDQYGFCGYELDVLQELLMSNGANIASGKTETLSDAKTGEALQMMYDMYNVYNICYPYDFDGNPSSSMRNQYTNGNVGFFPIAAWIQSGNNDYDWDGSVGTTLPFDIAYVRWPVGPSGNQETNAGKNSTSGGFFIIPTGVKDPETVYNVLYDMCNWYNGDVSLRDDRKALNWWFLVTSDKPELQDANFEVMADCGSKTTFDLWKSMGFNYDIMSLIRGETTPAQFQETYKQQVQDGLDAFFN